MIAIRASSLSELTDCPARWEAKYVRGLRNPKAGITQLGTAIHAGTAAFDAAALAGNPVTVDEAAAAVADAIHKPQEDVAWDAEMSKDNAEAIGIALHKKYCRDIAPSQDYVAVEVTCERLEITDLGIALTGTADRVRRGGEDGVSRYGISDIKTGKGAVSADGRAKTQGYGMQLGVYELLAEAATGLPIDMPSQVVGMQTGATEKAQRVAIGTVIGARDILVGDHDCQGVLEYVARLVHSGNFYGNPRSMLCHPKYCPAFGVCRFRA